MTDNVFEKLKNDMAGDMEPVRPLGPPWKQAMTLLLLWPALVGLVIGIFGLRRDSHTLGPWLSWDMALVQIFAAYLIVMVGLRLSTPGRMVPASFLAVLAGGASAVHLAISEITFRLSPTHVEAARERTVALICFGCAFFLGLIPLTLVLFLSRRGLPMRPVLLGTVCGLGSGLAGEAAWRMHCPYNSWDHVLTAHTGAVLATTLAGGLLGFLWERHRLRMRKQSMPAGQSVH